ncbi:gamma aminobutyrate transaminase 2-like [Dorcoceras hygrometricum]|uniref:Gamma aminobutyrate transaminase 2-like n=1 Tax=Dorcoceras hygrometricum TaxID=472368 RepID=A0A2Z7B8U4_9LAMI|nr:gamma aminobutyrate transaminase 2-like [Dorcoceras hygrometricum]
MHGKSFNAPDLIKEDLLCFYKFSRKGVEFAGDLDERMGKAEMLKAMQEEAQLGFVAQVGFPPEEVPVRNWAWLPSRSGLCVCVEELREFSSSELGFVARVGLPPEEVPVRNWAWLPSWPGLFICVEELCEFGQCGTGLGCRAGRAYLFA